MTRFGHGLDRLRELFARMPGQTGLTETFEAIHDADLRDLAAYWREVKGVRDMPGRDDVDPADISELLPHVGLLDVERPMGRMMSPRFRYVFAGASLTAGYRRELAGRYLDEIEPGRKRPLPRTNRRAMR